MWQIKTVKQIGRGDLKRHYIAMVAICIIMTIVASEYSFSGAIFSTNTTNDYDLLTTNSATVFEYLDKYTKHFFNEHNSESTQKAQGVMSMVAGSIFRCSNAVGYAAKSWNYFATKHVMAEGFMYIGIFLLYQFYYFFIHNVLIVGERRYFLECKVNDKVAYRRLLFPYSERHTINIVKVMALRFVFNFLWMFTIVGGIYKFYQYYMMPYILAENPDMDWKTCFKLSKQMTKGYKWQLFCFDLSFLGWYILSGLTMGILSILYVNPYVTASETNIYLTLRENAIEYRNEGYEQLTPIESEEAKKLKLVELGEDLVEKIQSGDTYSWKRSYSIENLMLMFFSFMVIGWLWEVLYALILHGTLVNRGSLHGPWLPIYGVGGIMIVILMRKLGNKPIVLFLVSFVMCGCVEYLVGWYFDNYMGVKYWDYSNYFLNLNGYICLEGVFMFAILASAGFYLISPRIDALYSKIPMLYRRIILAILIPIFAFDVVYSHFDPNVGENIGGKDYM